MKNHRLIAALLSGCMIVAAMGTVGAQEEELSAASGTETTLQQLLEETAQPENETVSEADDAAEEEATLGALDANEQIQATSLSAPDTQGMSQDEYFQTTIDQYDQYDWSDPQVIADADFFGVWDGTKWTKEPYFDYSYSPDLAATEAAAKRGDYETAKEEILEYYREVFKTHRRGLEGVSDKRKRLLAQATFENLIKLWGYGEPVEKWNLTEEQQTFTADVRKDVESAISAVTKQKAFNIIALKKDGYEAVFDSKEAGGTGPYIELSVNGNSKTIYPTYDATIIAGDKRTQNFGTERTLRVEESYTSIGTQAEVDTYTKRAYLMFDFSDLNSGDVIDSAVLYVNGRMVESDNPTAAPQVRTSKDVMLWESQELGWTETNITWSNRTIDIFSYDGELGPHLTHMTGMSTTIPSWADNMTKWQYAPNIAQCYLYYTQTGKSGGEAYAYHAIRMLMNTIERQKADIGTIYNCDACHNLGQRAKYYPQMIDMLLPSEYMTPEIFTAILKNVWMVNDYLVKGWNSSSESNNFGSLQAEGLFNLTISFMEFQDASKPATGLKNSSLPGSMQGGWLAVAKHRLGYKVMTDLFDDGSSIEVGLGYADLNLNTFLNSINNAEMVGLDGRDLFSAEELEFMEKYALYLMNASTPTWGDWQQGHAYTHASNYAAKWTTLNELTQNPYLMWATSGGKEGEKPEYTSIAYDIGQKAVLRTDWGTSEAVAMQINADGGVKSHGQNDDLGLNFYAYGQHFLVDPLYHNYTSTDPMNLFLNSTRAHNTIEINGVSQKGGLGSSGSDPAGNKIVNLTGGQQGSLHPENREFNTMYNFLRAETVNYKNNSAVGGNFTHYRDILFLKPDFAIVTDYLEPDNDNVNTYSQNWHFLPDAGLTIDTATNTVTTHFESANLILAPVNQEHAFDKAQLSDGWYALKAGTEVDAKYVTYEKTLSGPTTFNTVLYPVKPGQRKTVTTQNLTLDVPEETANAFQMVVTNQDTGSTENYTYYANRGENVQRTVGNYTTDADLMLVEKNGATNVQAILRGGTNIIDETTGKYLIKSETDEVKDLGIQWQGNIMNVTASEGLKEEDGTWKNVAIYTDKKIVQITYTDENGTEIENIPFKQEGAYVYFGTPFLGDSTEITDSTSGGTTIVNPDGTHGTGGSNSGGGSGSGSGGSSGGNGSGGTVTPITPTPTPTGGTSDDEHKLTNGMKAELEGHWAQQEITEMVEDGIVNGVSQDSLGLAQTTPRAECTAMLVRALGLEGQSYNGEFADVSSGDWYADIFATAKQSGLVEGSDGNANPNALITREEMACMLVRAYQLKNGSTDAVSSETAFIDDAEISEWARASVAQAEQAGLLKGMEDGSFAPKEHTLREQAIVAVYRLLNK